LGTNFVDYFCYLIFVSFSQFPVSYRDELPKLFHFCMALTHAWATSSLRATYGLPSPLMWLASYMWSFLSSYFDYENKIKNKKISTFSWKTISKLVYMNMYWAGDTDDAEPEVKPYPQFMYSPYSHYIYPCMDTRWKVKQTEQTGLLVQPKCFL